MKNMYFFRSVVFGLFCFISYLAIANIGCFYIDNGIRYYVYENDDIKYAQVHGYIDKIENKKMYSGTISIPDSIEFEGQKFPVDGFASYAMDGCSDLEELIFSANSQNLYFSKFSIANCGEIKLTLPTSIKLDLGYGVLYNTKLQHRIDLPMFQSTGGEFFSAMPWLEKFNIKNYTYYIGPLSFCNCNIKEIEFEDNTTTSPLLGIGGYAFGDSKIEEIRLPIRRLILFNFAFGYSNALKKLTFSDIPLIILGGNDNKEVECNPEAGPIIVESLNLAEIICESVTPPDILERKDDIGGYYYVAPREDYVFMDDNSHTFLRVPAGSEHLYAEHPIWGQFVNISDLDGNIYRSAQLDQITSMTETSTRRIMSDGQSPVDITIDATSTVTIYNINGIEIRSETADEGTFSTTLPAGVYIVAIRPK